MRNILHWNPNRKDKYTDGECSTVEELPEHVPGGSVWHVTETDKCYLMHPTTGSWIDVAAAANCTIDD